MIKNPLVIVVSDRKIESYVEAVGLIFKVYDHVILLGKDKYILKTMQIVEECIRRFNAKIKLNSTFRGKDKNKKSVIFVLSRG